MAAASQNVLRLFPAASDGSRALARRQWHTSASPWLSLQIDAFDVDESMAEHVDGGVRLLEHDVAHQRGVEAALLGGPISAQAADQVHIDIQPIDDVRSTAAYRLAVAARVVRSWLERAAK